MASSWVLFSVIVTTLNFVKAAVELDFRVTPTVVKPLETDNVTLQCSVTEKMQYYNRDYFWVIEGGQYVSRTSPPPRKVSTTDIAMIRILKNLQDKWQVIAQISNVAPTTTHKLDSRITNASGIIYEDSTLRSFVEVRWDLATADVYGKYRCDAITFDSSQNAVLSTSSEISLGSALNSLDLLRLFKHDTSAIFETINEVKSEQREMQNITAKLKNDYQKLEEYTVNKNTELDEKVKTKSELLESQVELLGERINDMEREVTDVISKVQERVNVAMDSGFLMLWPRGNYGLLKPASGCPFGGITSWKTGWRRHHTESTDRNQDSLSTQTHLQEPVLERLKGNNFVTQHFCIKTEENTIGPNWPRGSYCINKKGECPELFQEGYFTWDEENDGKLQALQDELPTGVYNDNDITTIEYCCRQDAPANTSAYLPNSDPFYLYRYGGSCQQIYGMVVTEEYLIFDTENTNNGDKISQFHPDGTINNVRLELCYYQRS